VAAHLINPHRLKDICIEQFYTSDAMRGEQRQTILRLCDNEVTGATGSRANVCSSDLAQSVQRHQHWHGASSGLL